MSFSRRIDTLLTRLTRLKKRVASGGPPNVDTASASTLDPEHAEPTVAGATRFIYPNAILGRAREEWARPYSREFDIPDLPSDSVLAELIETIYHCSFTMEEHRRTKLQVIFAEPLDQPRAIVLNPPRRFSVSELMRLAPASNIEGSAIGVSLDSTGALRIWGLATDPFGPVPVISTQAPGSVSLSRYGRLLLRLHHGAFSAPAIDEFFIVEAFQSAADELLEQLDGTILGNAYDPAVHYGSPLFEVLRRASEEGHGAAVFVLPDARWQTHESRNMVRIKYACHDDRMWPSMQLLMRAIAHDVDVDSERQWGAGRMTREWPKRVAALTRVDGAVLMTDRYRLLGFGVEVVAASALATIEMSGGEVRRVEDYGTRHRSAFRLCHLCPDVVAFVCSQDGGIKCVRNKDGIIKVWQ